MGVDARDRPSPLGFVELIAVPVEVAEGDQRVTEETRLVKRGVERRHAVRRRAVEHLFVGARPRRIVVRELRRDQLDEPFRAEQLVGTRWQVGQHLAKAAPDGPGMSEMRDPRDGSSPVAHHEIGKPSTLDPERRGLVRERKHGAADRALDPPVVERLIPDDVASQRTTHPRRREDLKERDRIAEKGRGQALTPLGQPIGRKHALDRVRLGEERRPQQRLRQRICKLHHERRRRAHGEGKGFAARAAPRRSRLEDERDGAVTPDLLQGDRSLPFAVSSSCSCAMGGRQT